MVQESEKFFVIEKSLLQPRELCRLLVCFAIDYVVSIVSCISPALRNGVCVCVCVCVEDFLLLFLLSPAPPCFRFFHFSLDRRAARAPKEEKV